MISNARHALIRARQQNINRYCRLLATELTDHERQYLHRRIVEERAELERLMGVGPAVTTAVSAPPLERTIATASAPIG